MKDVRSEFDANEQQARRVINETAARMARDATRRDWRAILAERDAEREARNRRNARRMHGRNHGRASLGTLATIATAAGAIVAAIVRTFGG